MNQDDIQQNPFSLIADFDGDITSLFNQEPGESLPILPLRNMTLFPGVVAPVAVGRESSRALIQQASRNGGFIGVVCQRDASVEEPTLDDVYPVGVMAKVMRVIEMPGGAITAILQSYSRLFVLRTTRMRPFIRAHVERLEDLLPEEGDREFQALVDNCKDRTTKLLRMSDNVREEAVYAIRNISNPVFLLNFICTNLPFPIEEKQGLLDEADEKQRAYKLLTIINREVQYAMLKQDIQAQTRSELDKQQKDYFLQQQIKNIQSELGMEHQSDDESRLHEKASKANLPESVQTVFTQEMEKLSRINQQSPDYSVQINYLETLLNIPWSKQTADNLDIVRAKRILNRDHYGMEKVKERILEHLAVLRYRQSSTSPIICLYGPPGVGKTSLGRSIAEALGRKYIRMSLGGVHDEAEIRGHRRTYVGAMPGRIVKGLIKAGSNNPVFILDEIDKVAQNNISGDPQSALLEVLDPEQNNAFHDNYLDLDCDLSKVLFIATANNIGTIPPALLDRMELIEVEGYLTEEKKEIARRHLVPKEQKEIKFDDAPALKISAAAIETMIEKYTRESGVRQLEKLIGKVFRKVAYRKATEEDYEYPTSGIKLSDLDWIFGKPPYNRDKYQGNSYAGVVTGLAWTSVGGEILYIEAGVSRSKSPRLTLTGNLGDVMKESAMLALEYVKAHADKIGVDFRVFEQYNIHIHVPEGATPKDGPSAGITIATALASALTRRKVREGVAMTGEITLRGKVLPVGGIKEKILAAKRAGITHIVMSEENRKDIEEINSKYVDGLTFHFVDNVEEVLAFALLEEKADDNIKLDIKEDTPTNA